MGSLGRSVVLSFRRSVVRSFGRSIVRSFGRSVVRSFGRSTCEDVLSRISRRTISDAGSALLSHGENTCWCAFSKLAHMSKPQGGEPYFRSTHVCPTRVPATCSGIGVHARSIATILWGGLGNAGEPTCCRGGSMLVCHSSFFFPFGSGRPSCSRSQLSSRTSRQSADDWGSSCENKRGHDACGEILPGV